MSAAWTKPFTVIANRFRRVATRTDSAPLSTLDGVWQQLHERRTASDPQEALGGVGQGTLKEVAGELNRLRPIRFVDVRRPQEFAAVCAAHSLNAGAVHANLQLVRRHTAGGPAVTETDHPALVDGEHFARFSVGIIERGQLTSTDPWSAEEIASRLCISSPGAPYENVPVHGFRFGTERPFYLIFQGLVDCYPENFLYLPQDELLFFGRDERFVEPLVSQWRAFCVRHAATVFERLGDVETAKPAVLVRALHFGHHIWNELSFLELLTASPAASQTTVIAARWPMGSIATMFPELRVIELPAGQSLEKGHHSALEGGYLCAPCGRLWIPPALIRRLLSFAASQCADAKAEADRFRQRHSPVLWVSVRSDQRTWLNQDSVLGEVLGVLLRDFPSMGLVIDGFSWPMDVGPAFGFPAAELEIAHRFVDGIVPADQSKVLIGRSLLEALVWTSTADTYLTHHGSLHHKIAWFADIPGVVHIGEGTVSRKLDKLLGVVAGLRKVRPVYLFGAIDREEGTSDKVRSDASYTLDAETVLSAMRQALSYGTEKD